TIKFDSIHHTLPVPFVIYADLEAILHQICNNKQLTDNVSGSIKLNEHVPCSYGYKVVCCYDDQYSKPYKEFRGIDTIYKFFEALFEEEEEINKLLIKFKNNKIIMTSDDRKNYHESSKCYICDNLFTEDSKKCRDHCHVTGKYRGAACNNCNLKLKLSSTIPVLFPNLRGYDSHHLIKELGRFKKSISVIPNNMEKYMSFSVGKKVNYKDEHGDEKQKEVFNLKFIDSFQFMASSLDQLVKDLRNNGIDKFKYTQQEFGVNADIMVRKGVYPYSFIDSWDKFDMDIKDLKPEHSTNDLTGEEVKDVD